MPDRLRRPSTPPSVLRACCFHRPSLSRGPPTALTSAKRFGHRRRVRVFGNPAILPSRTVNACAHSHAQVRPVDLTRKRSRPRTTTRSDAGHEGAPTPMCARGHGFFLPLLSKRAFAVRPLNGGESVRKRRCPMHWKEQNLLSPSRREIRERTIVSGHVRCWLRPPGRADQRGARSKG